MMMMIEAEAIPITIHISGDDVWGRGRNGSPAKIFLSSGSTYRETWVDDVDVGEIVVVDENLDDFVVDEEEEEDDDVLDKEEEDDDVLNEEEEEDDDDVLDEDVEEDDDDEEDEDEDAAKHEAGIDAASEISLKAIEAALFCLEDDEERMRGGAESKGHAEIDGGGALDGSGRGAKEDDDDGVETDARTLDSAAMEGGGWRVETDGCSEGGALTEGRGWGDEDEDGAATEGGGVKIAGV